MNDNHEIRSRVDTAFCSYSHFPIQRPKRRARRSDFMNHSQRKNQKTVCKDQRSCQEKHPALREGYLFWACLRRSHLKHQSHHHASPILDAELAKRRTDTALSKFTHANAAPPPSDGKGCTFFRAICSQRSTSQPRHSQPFDIDNTLKVLIGRGHLQPCPLTLP